jgi:hypothetical protein
MGRSSSESGILLPGIFFCQSMRLNSRIKVHRFTKIIDDIVDASGVGVGVVRFALAWSVGARRVSWTQLKESNRVLQGQWSADVLGL